MKISKKVISALTAIAMSISAASVLAADIVTSGSSADKQDVIIMDNETVLVKDVDYTLEYKDNVNVGEATVIIHFIGNYSGEKEQKFNINRKSSGGGGGSSRPKPTPTPSPNTEKVTVTDKGGNTIDATKNTDDDKIIITLPDGVELDPKNPITITVEDDKNKPISNKDVIVRDTKGNEATGKTNTDGVVVVPTVTPENYDHNVYISGYENGTFKPDGNITRAETASMLNSVIEADSNSRNMTFSDLKDGAWYIDAVQTMTNAGIISGYTDGTFRPDRHITRAEFVAMLMRTKDIQTFDVIPFTDISVDLWSADYIYTAYTNGYINGYEDGTFKPDNPITRAEAVKIINSVLSRDDFTNKVNPFSDVSDTHWAYKQILEAAVSHNVN